MGTKRESTPDATTKLSRVDLRSGTSPAKARTFRWPSPAYFEFAAADQGEAIDDCFLVFGDGGTASGALLDFFPEAGFLKFQQKNADAAVSIAFSSLLRLELRRPVEVQREALPGSTEPRAFTPSDRRSFTVHLENGRILHGDTIGHVEAVCGLFLFLPDRTRGVMRHFIPTQSARSYSIGKPLGQMLIDQNLTSADAVDAALQKQATLRSQRFGEYLTGAQIVSPEQLAAALKQQSIQPEHKLGETLVELGYLSSEELDEALAAAKRGRAAPLGEILAEMGLVEPEVVNGLVAQKLGIPFVNLGAFEIPEEIGRRIPHAVAQRLRVVPLAESDNALVVAAAGPLSMAVLEELRFVAGSRVVQVIASEQDVAAALEKAYGPAAQAKGAAHAAHLERTGDLPLWRGSGPDVPVEQLAARLAAESADIDLNERHAAQSDTTLVKFVNKIILDAVEQRASDIHVESSAGSRGTRIRFRKDGALVRYLDMPARFRRAVISRIKIMAQLDITERRRPQDGKIDFGRFGPAQVELRVATIPTSNGMEDVVMRVLAAAKPVPLEQIGLDPGPLAALKRLVDRPHGLLLVCGPTGSGKTTSLHSLLGYLNTEDCKIWTAEDPIEISQPGLRQVQVNAKIGWTFAAAMRSFMRADPDVIMVGEMRDAETTKIGIEASLTGHLVLSTLHTNSAPESVTRLLDLGMDPFNFADALLGVLAQRLVRRLCEDCRQRYEPAGTELEELAAEYCAAGRDSPEAVLRRWREGAKGAVSLYRRRGCQRCDHRGYRGRVGVYELLVADEGIKKLIQSRAPVAEIAALAMAGGMRTLKQDAIEKVLRGLTDLHEARTV